MMIKRLIKTLMAAALMIGIFAGMAASASAESETDEIRVVLDGEALRFDVPPVIRNGRTLVPLREVFEAMGAEVSWDGDAQTVTYRIRSDGTDKQQLTDFGLR